MNVDEQRYNLAVYKNKVWVIDNNMKLRNNRVHLYAIKEDDGSSGFVSGIVVDVVRARRLVGDEFLDQVRGIATFRNLGGRLSTQAVMLLLENKLSRSGINIT